HSQAVRSHRRALRRADGRRGGVAARSRGAGTTPAGAARSRTRIMSSIHDVWYGDKAVDRTARAVLAPASWLYETIIRVRDKRYSRSDAVHQSAVPVLSLGNITVGG